MWSLFVLERPFLDMSKLYQRYRDRGYESYAKTNLDDKETGLVYLSNMLNVYSHSNTDIGGA